MGETVSFASVLVLLDDPSRVAECRRVATVMAERESLTSDQVSNAAIIATELATNLLKHAKSGEIHIAPLSPRGLAGIEILSIDRGPGIPNIGESLKDGHSTAGTSGTGLGAVRRLSDEFDIYSQPGKGTVVVSQIFLKGGATPPFRVGLAARPISGESVSGDSWAIRFEENAVVLLVADGLGHGLLAADASRSAVEAFRRSNDESPAALVQAMHNALRGTRGAAVAVARLEFQQSRVRFAGLGNIAGTVVSPQSTHAMVSHNGTAGYAAGHFREFVYPWKEESILVMHSDGLSTSWNAAAFPGLTRRHPTAIGALLYREVARDRDDACVVVVKK